jgi:hypothetical protein
MTFTPEKPRALSRIIWALVLGTGLGCSLEPAVAAGEPTLGFNRDIRPILADKCFPCHGFDAKQRKAGLRLDTAEGAFGVTESGAVAIKPGDLDDSEVWRRINSSDPDEQMPPSKSHKTLSTHEKEAIRKWIAQGTSYQKHWAFEPPVRSPRPTVARGNAIDAFIVDQLRREGLTPSPEADRETLLRRVTFDLTGLPPSLEDIDAFLSDRSPEVPTCTHPARMLITALGHAGWPNAVFASSSFTTAAGIIMAVFPMICHSNAKTSISRKPGRCAISVSADFSKRHSWCGAVSSAARSLARAS